VNLQGFSVIHDSNLVAGQRYYLKNRFGEAWVKVLDSVPDGWNVEVQEGGFNTPKGKYKKGEVMLVENGQGKWYEAR